MIAGHVPYSGDTPLEIYRKVLEGDLKFPREFDKDAKSLAKHLLTGDVTKRYGCL